MSVALPPLNIRVTWAHFHRLGNWDVAMLIFMILTIGAAITWVEHFRTLAPRLSAPVAVSDFREARCWGFGTEGTAYFHCCELFDLSKISLMRC